MASTPTPAPLNMPDKQTVYLSLPQGPTDWHHTVTEVFASHGFNPLLRDDRDPALAWPQALAQTLARADLLVTIMAPAGLDHWQLREQAVFAEPANQRDPNWPQGVLVLPAGHSLPAALGFPRPWVTLDDPATPGTLPIAINAALAKRAKAAPGATAQCPYPGMRSFDASEAALFFGRRQEITQLSELLRKHPLVMLSGASGVGKCSLVQAGLFPSKGRPAPNAPWECIGLALGHAPFHALGAALAVLLQADSSAEQLTAAGDDIGNQLQTGSVGLDTLVTQLLKVQHGSAGVLLHLRGIETLATEPPDATMSLASDFTAMLVAACAQAPLRVVISLDSRFQAALLRRLPEFGQACAWMPLAPLRGQALRETVSGPAAIAGLSVDTDLLDTIDADAIPDAAHPAMLACTLEETWQRRSDQRLSLAAYHAAGGLTHCFERRANRAWQSLGSEQRRHLQEVWEQRIDSDDAGLHGDHDEAPGQVWSRTRAWNIEHSAFLAWRQGIAVEMRDWQQAERKPDRLLQGPMQAEAEAWLQRRGSQLDPQAREFIRAGMRSKQRGPRSRRNRRREAALAIALATAVIGLGITGSQWWLATQRTDFKPVTAGTGQTDYPAMSDVQVTDQQRPEIFAESSLANTDTSSQADSEIAIPVPTKHPALVVPGGRVSSLAFSADGSFLLTGSNNGYINLWEVASSESRQQLQADNRSIAAIGFFNRERQFYTASSYASVNLWQLPPRNPQLLRRGGRDRITTIHANSSGTRLLIADSNHSLDLYDPILAKHLQSLDGHLAEVIAAAFSDNDERLVTADEEGNIGLWDAISTKPLRMLRGHRSFIDNLEFDAQSERFLSAGGDGRIRLWNAHDGDQLLDITAADGRIHVAHFSPSGSTIASSTADGGITLWDSGSGEAVAKLEGHSDIVRAFAFSPNGRWLASASDDHSLRLWDLATNKDRVLFRDQSIRLREVRFDPAGKWLAVTSNSAKLLLWAMPARPTAQ